MREKFVYLILCRRVGFTVFPPLAKSWYLIWTFQAMCCLPTDSVKYF